MKINDGAIITLVAGILAIVVFMAGAICNANFWFLMFNLFAGIFLIASAYEDEWVYYEEDSER